MFCITLKTLEGTSPQISFSELTWGNEIWMLQFSCTKANLKLSKMIRNGSVSCVTSPPLFGILRILRWMLVDIWKVDKVSILATNCVVYLSGHQSSILDDQQGSFQFFCYAKLPWFLFPSDKRSFLFVEEKILKGSFHLSK